MARVIILQCLATNYYTPNCYKTHNCYKFSKKNTAKNSTKPENNLL